MGRSTEDRTGFLQHKHRLPAMLKQLLEEASKKNKRSLTAEINARLERSFTDIPSAAADTSDPNVLSAIMAMDMKIEKLSSHLGVKIESQDL